MSIRILPALAALCLAAAPALARSPSTVFLEELTWTELRDDVRTGKTTVLLPVGGTEQSGPHMALGKHNVRVRVLAGRIAAGLGNALVAPVVAYVPEGSVAPPSGHMRFAGTLSVPEGAFETTLEYAARSLRQAGFRDIVLLGDHGGYQSSLVRVAAKLNREWAGAPAHVHADLVYYQSASRDFAAALRKQGFADAEIGSHAGLADTSLAMAVDAALVRTDRLSDVTPLADRDGVAGDPRRASAELGRPGVERVVAATVESIRKSVVRP
ncbi:MAG: creatininase family protein [Caldimonas sp.]